jgi:hypothetical protein
MIVQSGSRLQGLLKRVTIAIVLGFLATFGLNVLGYVADHLGYSLLSNVLTWPNALFQSLIPPHNIGTAESPIIVGTPLNFLAFIASIPFAWLVYSCITYAWLYSREQHAD